MQLGVDNMSKGVDIEIIVAMDKNRLIGSNGAMPWHIPSELQSFRSITTGGNIVMGRKTLESIGKALPNRVNICVSKSLESFPGVRVVNDLSELPNVIDYDKRIFIIGGGEMYKLFVKHASIMHVSIIKGDYTGDTYFPDFDESQWRTIVETDMGEFVYKKLRRK